MSPEETLKSLTTVYAARRDLFDRYTNLYFPG